MQWLVPTTNGPTKGNWSTGARAIQYLSHAQ